MLCLSSCSGRQNETTGAIDEELSIQQVKRNRQTDARKLNVAIDSIVVYKSRREMHVFLKRKKVKTYIISLGLQPVGAKRAKGDNKTPEGVYSINDRNPNSIYHKNLGVSYPNDTDRAYAARHKLNTGGDIKIHGLPNKPKYKPEAYLHSDWTWGCIAVSNEEIDELYRWVEPHAALHILP